MDPGGPLGRRGFCPALSWSTLRPSLQPLPTPQASLTGPTQYLLLYFLQAFEQSHLEVIDQDCNHQAGMGGRGGVGGGDNSQGGSYRRGPCNSPLDSL